MKCKYGQLSAEIPASNPTQKASGAERSMPPFSIGQVDTFPQLVESSTRPSLFCS